MAAANEFRPGDPRSKGANPQRRIPQVWPKDRRFRILSLDGGGIRGVFPATFLAELERRYCPGQHIADFFDLIAGTSTGGILALGLGARLSTQEISDLYLKRGVEIFPVPKHTFAGRIASLLKKGWHFLHYLYDRKALSDVVTGTLQDRLFGDSKSRLCIPAFDGKNSEVFVYKTPHHKDYRFDRFEKMITVALATAAAPTYFQPLKHGGYHLVDGGVWANNPVMIAVVEALICWEVSPDQIDVLSISCGEDPYIISDFQMKWSGKLFWSNAIFAAMRLQSLAATNQARLLLGPPSVVRVVPAGHQPPIALDDYKRAVDLLPADAIAAVTEHGSKINEMFFQSSVEAYVPVPVE